MAAAAGAGGNNTKGGPKIQEIDIPIVKGLASGKNGSIHVMGQNIEGRGWDNVFSFTYYFPSTSTGTFRDTVYFSGLRTYIDMVHGGEYTYPPLPEDGGEENGGGANDSTAAKRETARLPGNNGVVIYTTWPTLKMLAEEFSIEDYPNLVYAVPEWEYFSNEEELLSKDILRCMRYHAVELYPSLNVHMRDADTLFTAFLYAGGYDWARFQYLTCAWETTYLTIFLPEMEKQGKQIVLGGSLRYSAFYHSNIPYPVEFTFPLRKSFSGEKGLNPYKHIYIRSNMYTNDNIAELRRLRDEPIPQEEGENWSAYLTRKWETEKKKQQEYKATIPPERRQLIPYFDHFTKDYKYMYLKGASWFGEPGLFAGFTSVLKDRKGIEEFWKICVDYLVSRYYKTTDPETGKIILTDELIQELRWITSLEKISALKPLAFGKDERMLMYGILPAYFPMVYFFDMRYYKEMKSYTTAKDLEFLEPDYPAKLLEHNNYEHRELTKSFKSHTKSYVDWMSDMKKTYPTQKNFLNAIEANFQKRFVPFEEAMSQAPKNRVPFEGFVEPYKEFAKYGRATLPGKLDGGRRRPRTTRHRTRKSLKRKTHRQKKH